MKDNSSTNQKKTTSKKGLTFKTLIKGFYIYNHIETNRIEQIFKIHKEIVESKLNYLQNCYPTVGLKEHLELEQAHFQIFREVFQLKEQYGQSTQNLVLKPTSEAVMYPAVYDMINFIKKPYRWYTLGPVFRNESSVTKKYFRNKQIKYFFEGHSLFNTKAQAQIEIIKILKCLQEFFENIGLFPQINIRPKEDTFPGAQKTFAFDVLVEGKLIQIYTVHYLGTNFSKVFQAKTKNQDLYEGICFGGSERVYGCLEELYGANLKWILPTYQNINFLLKKDFDYSKYKEGPIAKTKLNIEVESLQNTEKEIQKINQFYDPCFITKIGDKEIETGQYMSIDYDTKEAVDFFKQKEHIQQKRKNLIDAKRREFRVVYNDVSKGIPLENIENLSL